MRRARSGAPALRSLKLDILVLERHYRRRVTSRKIRVFPPIFAGWEPKMLDRRSLLVAGASSLASIMLPRVPGTSNAFILPFAPTEAYADEKDPFRCSFSRAPCLVWSWSTSPTRIRPSRVPRSRSYRAMPQASSSLPLPMTKARPSLRSRRFQKATWTRQRFSTRTTLTAASPLAWRATAMSRFPLRVSRAAPP